MSTNDKKESEVLEIEKKEQPVKKAKPKAPPLQGVERRIAKLNAYRALLDHKLSLRGTPPDIKSEIEKEFRYWAEDQMLVHMGEYEENRVFTDEEIEALKGLAAKIMTKAQNPQPQQPKQPINPPPQQPPQPRYNNPRPHGRLRETMNMQQIRQRDQDAGNLLQKLEDMDRNGPEF